MTERLMVLDLRAKAAVWRIPERVEEEIAAGAPDGWRAQIVTTDTVSDGDGGHAPTAEALDAIRDAEVYYGFGITPQLFAAATKLRWVHTATAGVGSTLFPALKNSPVVLTNSAGVHAVPMAEYVIGALFHFWRGFDLTVENHHRGDWNRDAFVRVDTPVREAGESTVLIVGTGGIGREVALRLSALGATCIGVRRHPDREVPPGFSRVIGTDEIDRELPHVDAVVLGAPLTPTTKGLIDARRLDLLPHHAVVINVARGPIVDQQAIVERLADGRLRGAALDVFDEEPLPLQSPLWQLRRALVTPHISAVTPRRFWERQTALFLENVRRYTAGEPLRNVVDKDAGY